MSLATKLRAGFVEHLSRTYVAQQSVTKRIEMTATNLVTPRAAAKPELLLNKPGSKFSMTVIRKVSKQISEQFKVFSAHF